MSVHQLLLEEDFAVPSARLWSAITDHEGMRKWAGADVRIVAKGDASGVGTVRRIAIGPLRIDEEVIYADAPRRLVYRVVRGLPVRYHRGEILVTDTEHGSHLDWRIMVGSSAPGVARCVIGSLGPPLRHGLRQLRGLIGG
jgi:uncharacterized protein YndB with AHSA1/START domain